MRRASYTPAFKVSIDEPLIVVDESEELANSPTSPKSIEDAVDDDKESPDNPYLLSPWRDPRDTRKHSLPNLHGTDGITASQVRRLSDGGDNAPSVKEVEFLAKLSQVNIFSLWLTTLPVSYEHLNGMLSCCFFLSHRVCI